MIVSMWVCIMAFNLLFAAAIVDLYESSEEERNIFKAGFMMFPILLVYIVLICKLIEYYA